jgi:hypothetical protein
VLIDFDSVPNIKKRTLTGAFFFIFYLTLFATFAPQKEKT